MDRSESQNLFKQANSRYQNGDFAGALELLSALDRAHPNNHRILLPMARCLERLHRREEALALCDRLVDQLGYEKARPLKEKLEQERSQPIGVPGLPAGTESALPGLPDVDLDAGTFASLGPPPIADAPSRGFEMPSLIWWGLGALTMFLVLGVFTYFIGRPYIEYGLNAPDDAPLLSGPDVPWWNDALLQLVFGTVTSTIAGYLGLRLINSLPFDDFSSNLVDVAIFAFASSLLGVIPLIWLLIMPYAIYSHYDLNLTSLLILLLLFIAFSFIAGIVVILGSGLIAGMLMLVIG